MAQQKVFLKLMISVTKLSFKSAAISPFRYLFYNLNCIRIILQVYLKRSLKLPIMIGNMELLWSEQRVCFKVYKVFKLPISFLYNYLSSCLETRDFNHCQTSIYESLTCMTALFLFLKQSKIGALFQITKYCFRVSNV